MPSVARVPPIGGAKRPGASSSGGAPPKRQFQGVLRYCPNCRQPFDPALRRGSPIIHGADFCSDRCCTAFYEQGASAYPSQTGAAPNALADRDARAPDAAGDAVAGSHGVGDSTGGGNDDGESDAGAGRAAGAPVPAQGAKPGRPHRLLADTLARLVSTSPTHDAHAGGLQLPLRAGTHFGCSACSSLSILQVDKAKPGGKLQDYALVVGGVSVTPTGDDDPPFVTVLGSPNLAGPGVVIPVLHMLLKVSCSLE